MNQSFFVTSSGTEIGKTFVTSLLVKGLREKSRRVSVLKPIMSGFDRDDLISSDAGQLLSAAGIAVTPSSVADISPWSFTAPLSPDMAAQREGKSIDFNELKTFCQKQIDADADYTFIEAAGGIMAPLNEDKLMLDWAEALKIPALLVVGSYLGTISHSLTAIMTLRTRNIPIKAVFLNESETSPVPLEETKGAIDRFAPGLTIVPVPRHATDPALLYAALESD